MRHAVLWVVFLSLFGSTVCAQTSPSKDRYSLWIELVTTYQNELIGEWTALSETRIAYPANAGFDERMASATHWFPTGDVMVLRDDQTGFMRRNDAQTGFTWNVQPLVGSTLSKRAYVYSFTQREADPIGVGRDYVLSWLYNDTIMLQAVEESDGHFEIVTRRYRRQEAAETIRIGVAGVHSGDLAPYGLPTVNAAQMVVEQVNAAGGVLGRKVELVIEDDQCIPGVATNTAAKLLRAGVVAVIGHICSGATSAALAIYQPEGVVTISPSATNPALARFSNFFRTIAPDDAQSAHQVAYAVGELGSSRVAILHDRGDYGRGLAESAQDYLEDAGVEVVLFEGITVYAVDYSAIINRVASENADLVIYGGYHPEAAKLVDQMRSRGLTAAFMSGDGIFNDTFIDLAGAAAEGVYATSPKDTGDNPIAVAAIAAHVAKYGEEPGAFFMNAYAATQALLNAISKAGSTEYAAVVAALRRENIDTPLGRITFDETGDATGVGFSLYRVQGGRFVRVSN